MSVDLLVRELQIVLTALAGKPKQVKDTLLIASVQQELGEVLRELNEKKTFNGNRMMKCVQELCAVDNIALHLTFTTFLTKLISLNRFNEVEFHQSTIEYLISYQGRASDELIIKGFQCFMPIVQHDSLHFGNIMFVERVLQYALSNRDSKIPFVSQSCLAVLNQTFESLADDISQCCSRDALIDTQIFQAQATRKVITNKWLQGLCRMMLDAVSIINDQRPGWIPGDLDKELALRLLHLCIENMTGELMKKQEIQNIFKYNLINVFKKALALQDRNQTIITFKCVQLLLERESTMFIEFVDVLKKYIQAPEHTIHKVLSMQALIILATRGIVAQSIQGQPAKTNPFFQILLQLSEIAQNTEILEISLFERYANINELSVLNTDSNPPLLIRLITLFIERLTRTINPAIVEVLWKPCHRTLKHILRMEVDMNLCNLIFESIEIWLELLRESSKEGLDYFVKLVCSCTKGKNLQAKKDSSLKTLIVVISQMGRILSCEQWTEIIRSFVEAQLEACEVTPVFQNFAKILGQCYEYDHEHLLLVLESVFKFIYNLQEEYLQVQDKNPTQNAYFQSKVNSALDKLLIMATKNLFRLDVMWEMLKSYLLDFIDSKSSILMDQAARTLCDIIVIANGFLPSFLNKLEDEESKEITQQNYIGDKWSFLQFQDTLLQPLIAMYVVNTSEVREIVFRTLAKINTLYQSGWRQVLLLIKIAHKEAMVIYDVLRLIGQLTSQLGHCDDEQLDEYLFTINQIQKRYRLLEYDELICNILYRISQFFNNNPEIMIRVLEYYLYFASVEYQESREAAVKCIASIIGGVQNKDTKWLSGIVSCFFRVHEILIKGLQSEEQNQWETLTKNCIVFHRQILKDCLDEGCQEILLIQITGFIHKVLTTNQRSLIPPYTLHIWDLYQQYRRFFHKNPTYLQVLDYFSSCFVRPCVDPLLLICYIQGMLPVVKDMVLDILLNSDKLPLGAELMDTTIVLLSKMIMLSKNDQVLSCLESHQIIYTDPTERIMIRFTEAQSQIPELEQPYYECWNLVLDVPPYDDWTNQYLMDQLGMLHLSIKSLTAERQILRFLQKLSSFVKKVRSDGNYLRIAKGKSLWMKAAEVLLDIGTSHLNEEIIMILQDTLPSKDLFVQVVSLGEHIEMQKQYLETIVNYYLEEQVEHVEMFQQFISQLTKVVELNKLQDVLIAPVSAIILLSSKEGYKSNLSIPLMTTISEQILREFIAQQFKYFIIQYIISGSKLMIFLLQRMCEIHIPSNSYKFKYSETSVMQIQVGHLVNLMPLMAKCVVTQEQEVRQVLSKALSIVSDELVSQSIEQQ